MLVAVLAAFLFQPDFTSIRRIFEDGLARRIQQFGAEDSRTAQASRDLGMFLKQAGKIEDARGVLYQTLRYDEAAFGAKALQTLQDAAELAAISFPAQAEPLWLRAAQSPEAGLAATAFDALAALRGAAGDTTGAANFYRKALAAEQTASGARSPQVAVRMSALGMVVKPAEGMPLVLRALEIERDALGPGHPQTATTATNLAGMLLNAGKIDGAIVLLERAITVFEVTLGKDHPRVATATSILGSAYDKKGDRVRAVALLRHALAIDEKAYGADHEQTVADRKHLVEVLNGPQ